MIENLTKEEIKKAKDAFYRGDIGSNNATGYALLHKDEETINLIGKVLFNLADNEWLRDLETSNEDSDLDLDAIAEVVGSLVISQFKGDDKQDHYRAIIEEIFQQYKDRN